MEDLVQPNLIENKAYNLKQKEIIFFFKKNNFKINQKKKLIKLFSDQFDNFVKNIKIKKSKKFVFKSNKNAI